MRVSPQILVVPVLALSAALGLFQLGQPALWIDEAFTWHATTTHGYVRLADELHWLYYTVMKPWVALAGTSEFALRVPSVVGAVVAVALLYGLVRMLFDTNVALVAALLLSVNPFVVKWSQQARSYTILLALAIATTWLLLRALEREKMMRFVAYGLVALTMVIWQFLAALFLMPVHVLIAWRSRRALLWISAVLLAGAPWVVQVLAKGDEGTRGPGTLTLAWVPTPGLDDLGDVSTSLPGALGVGLVLAALGAVRAGRHRTFLLLWAGVPCALSLVISVHQPVFIDRYLIVSCPAFAILGAVALVKGLGVVRFCAGVAAATATVAALVVWYAPGGGDNWVGENWRAATVFVMREGGGARVNPLWARPAFIYYGGREADTGWVLDRNVGSIEGASLRAQFGKWLRLVHIRAPQARRHNDAVTSRG
ncbi:MAG TPA: glycosyltransferase family 39 protein [Gemmatimonadaceae bacterium]|nr:glycosyltransferase family 39 protein [Gemmatimonadaceae bacterium]